jgi:DinB superfamily
MSDQNGKEIAAGIRAKAAEFRKSCEGLDDESASRAPEGRWSPRQIISHLCGPEGVGHLPTLNAFINLDTPEVDMRPENPYWGGKRARMSLRELLDEFDREYENLAAFVETLSEEQLGRKAHIPMLKDSELGEYPTLAQWAFGIGNFHVGFHINHLKEILQTLGAESQRG